MSNNKKISIDDKISVGLVIAMLLPTILMGLIYAVGAVVCIPMAYLFISEMGAPIMITLLGYVAVTAMLIIGTIVYLKFVITVTVNSFENL